MTKELVDEKVTRHDGSQKNSLPPLRGRVGVGGSLTMGKYEPRPCGCNTRKLVNNRFPALKGWGLRGDTSQSLINVKGLARASRGRALSSKMIKSLQTTSADPFNASEQEFAYSPIGLFALKRAAFTLAEILVTLGVIGIVAAMTIPNLVQSYKKKVVETRLLQFYSMMNQTVKLSEIDHGEEFSWLPVDSSTSNLKPYSIEEYYNEYLAPYLKTAKTEVHLDGEEPHIRVYFANGSAVYITNQATKDREPHFLFFPFGVVKGTFADCNSGIDCFLFIQNLQQFSSPSVLYQHGVQPYTWISGKRWATVTDKDAIDKILRDDTTRGCNNLQNDRGYCTAVIMRNGWKIPDDYPFKF